MTDDKGNLVWFGNYYGWGKLKSETNVTIILMGLMTQGMTMKITLAILILMVMLAHQEEDLEKQMEIISLINI